MQVKIEKTFDVQAPIDRVWALLSDPDKVVGCVPGAQITEQVDARNYKGAVRMKIGPVVTDFKGDVLIETLDDQAHLLVLKANGMDAKGKGSAEMTMTGRLQAIDGGTQIANTMEVTVIGRLAQFGARLMEDVSNRMFEQFVACFEEKLRPDPPAPTPAAAAPPIAPPASLEAALEAATDGVVIMPTAPGIGAMPEAAPGTASDVRQPTRIAAKTPTAPKASPTPPAVSREAPEPIKALPLLFKALGDAIARFFRRLFGRGQ